ncbi:MAG: hypothetical protein JRN20_22745 [Nitrososphaerota archaeon]|nr:hypothetical protein [Nitrososphaerota archaeon]
MSAKTFIGPENVMFLLAGIYFVVVAALGESSIYSTVGSVFCFVAVGLAFKEELVVAGPWRTATAAFSALVFAGQIVANAYSRSFTNVYQLGSTLLNGVFLVLFIGIVLSTSRDMMRKSEQEKTRDEKSESKKLAYEI